MCPLKFHKYWCRAAAEAWAFGRGSWAIQSAIGRLLKPSGSKNMAGSISATGGLQSSPGLSRAAGQIGKSDFFCSLFRPRARFGTRLGREGVVMPVLSASEGAQRRPNAQKRRGVRALFGEPNGWKFGHKAPRGLSSGALGRKRAAMRVFWPGPGPRGGASSYSTKKIGPRTRTPSARTCTRWGGEIRFFFASHFCLGLAVAIPDAPAGVLPGCVVGVRIWGGCWLTFRGRNRI